MYAPTAGHEGIVFEGHRPESQSQAASMLAPTSAYWDEPTVVAPGGPQSMNKYKGNDSPNKSPSPNSPQPKNRTEIYACGYPGCQRKFVNQAELRNHIDVKHNTDQDDFVSSAFDQQSETVEQLDFSPETAHPSSYPTSQHGDKTIKPVPNPNPNRIPITAAALHALNSSDEPDLTDSMRELSIAGSDGRVSAASLMSYETTYSVAEGAEDVAWSEVAEPDSPIIRLPVRILLKLWANFIRDFSARYKAPVRQSANYQAPHDQQASDSRPNESTAKPTQPPSVASSARASKRKENFDDDGQENGRRPSKIRPPRNQISLEDRPFACPFNKFDSYTFGGDASNPAYHTCSTWHDVKTAYLKQHIIRNHCLPEYHCQRCGDDFKNDKDLRNHLRMNPPCETKDIDSQKLMPEIQLELNLRTRNAASTNRTLYWYKVYDTIFGSEARQRRPVEPYYMGPSHEVLESFLHFSERRIPHVIQQSRRILNLNPEDYNEHNEQHVQLVRTILQEASQDFMANRRDAQAQSLKSIHEQNTPAEETEDDLGDRTITVTHEKKALVDRSAARRPETASYSWNQQTSDFTQSPNETFHQQLPHASPFAQGHMYNSPTANMDATLAQKQVGPSGYDDPASFAYQQFTTENFDHAFLNQPEFLATIEDPDMYGSSSIDANDIGGYEFSGSPYRRERKLP